MKREIADASPARLYAALVGALLIVVGIVGFFFNFSFDGGAPTDEVLGTFEVNGWCNVAHIATGAIGLLVAGYAARSYALWVGALYVAVGIWGLILGGGEILGLLPVNGGDNFLHLALGALGICAAFATPKPGAAAGHGRKSKPARTGSRRGKSRDRAPT